MNVEELVEWVNDTHCVRMPILGSVPNLGRGDISKKVMLT
jgi:hypothetical protein